MSKTTIVLDVFRAADNAGILMESVCEHFGISAEAAFSCAQRQDKESGAPLTAPAPLTDELPELPVPLEIDWPQLHSQALGCGVEDRSIHDRYEAAEYGWQVGMEAAAECVPELIYDEEAVLAIQREAYELGRDKAAPAPQQSMLTDERIEELFMPMMPWLPSKHGLQQFARVIEREVAKAAPAAPVQTAEPKRIPDMLTVETIQGAIAFGRMGINPPPSPDHWGNEFWQIGRQLAKLGETSAWDNVTPVDVAAPVQADQAQVERAAAVRADYSIRPVKVERDENGWWSHPGIPNFDEDAKSFAAWVKAVGLEVKYKCLESYPEHPLYEAWFERGECNASSWEPEEPAGKGWFIFSIHDTEDGPVWVWARRTSTNQADTDTGSAA